jgi:hypothetical protein
MDQAIGQEGTRSMIDAATIRSEAELECTIAEGRMLRARDALFKAEAWRCGVKAAELNFRVFFYDHFIARQKLAKLREESKCRP